MKFSTAVLALTIAVSRVSAQYSNSSAIATPVPASASHVTVTEDITKIETVTVIECCSEKCSSRVTTEVHTTTETCDACQHTTATSSYVMTKGSSVITVYSPYKTAVHDSTQSAIPRTASLTVHGSSESPKVSSHASPSASSHGTSLASHVSSHASSNSSSHASSAPSSAHVSAAGNTNHTTAAHVIGGASKAQMAGSFIAIAGAIAVFV